MILRSNAAEFFAYSMRRRPLHLLNLAVKKQLGIFAPQELIVI